MFKNRLAIAVVLTAALAAVTPALNAAASQPQRGATPGLVSHERPSEHREIKSGKHGSPSGKSRAEQAAKHGKRYKADTRPCRNRLVRVLSKAGFRGKNLREAWAIAMRESGGRPNIGPGHPDYNGADVGMFQFNMPSYSNTRWWNTRKLMKARYNAKIAFRISRGGKTWYPWGLDGRGRPNAHVYESIWSKETIRQRITKPYRYWYSQFPC